MWEFLRRLSPRLEETLLKLTHVISAIYMKLFQVETAYDVLIPTEYSMHESFRIVLVLGESISARLSYLQ